MRRVLALAVITSIAITGRVQAIEMFTNFNNGQNIGFPPLEFISIAPPLVKVSDCACRTVDNDWTAGSGPPTAVVPLDRRDEASFASMACAGFVFVSALAPFRDSIAGPRCQRPRRRSLTSSR